MFSMTMKEYEMLKPYLDIAVAQGKINLYGTMTGCLSSTKKNFSNTPKHNRRKFDKVGLERIKIG